MVLPVQTWEAPSCRDYLLCGPAGLPLPCQDHVLSAALRFDVQTPS